MSSPKDCRAQAAGMRSLAVLFGSQKPDSEPYTNTSRRGRRETQQKRGPQPEAALLPSRQKLGRKAEEHRRGSPPFMSCPKASLRLFTVKIRSSPRQMSSPEQSTFSALAACAPCIQETSPGALEDPSYSVLNQRSLEAPLQTCGSLDIARTFNN